MNTNVLNIIKKQYDSFSKSQKLIADYILENFSMAANMTASKLAEIVLVSESTVVRFATELGYLGYPEFTDALLDYIRNESTIIKRMESISVALENQDLLSTIINSDINNLKSTLNKVDRGGFDNAVDAILNANKIYILGVRSSACLASFAGFYFNLIFNNVRLVHTTSVSEMFEQILRVEKGDVVFGISFPRYSRRTVRALEFAKSRGATIVSLTDTPKSPLAPYTDCLITANSELVTFVDSLTAPLSILNALIAALVMKKKDEVTHIFEELEQIWEEYQVYDK
jgi:DNA-binding MurR/RpiR family transcriptional regulator